jgi:KDO2-lipid IV(A) lauroyltransferase
MMSYVMIKWINTWLKRLIIWPITAALIYIIMGFRFIIPVRWASAFMGFIVRFIAPMTSWHSRARKNIQLVMPELSPAEQNRILRAMWWNLGRTVGEFPYLDKLSRPEYVTEHGNISIDQLASTGGFMIGAHIGNWELSAMPLISRNIPFSIIYRPLNNPLGKHALNKRLTLARKTYVKGMESARGIIETARQKNIMILLVDQKLREGMVVPFFGKGATTPVSYIRAALKHHVPLVLVRVKRRKKCQFDLYLEAVDTTSIIAANPDKNLELSIATAINLRLEEWIREMPEQWFWPHRRWPESKNETPHHIGH